MHNSSALKQKQSKNYSHSQYQENSISPQTANPLCNNKLPITKTIIQSPITVVSDENDPDAGHECPICLSWLNEPVQTKCGHRFCKLCLKSWLENGNQTCPTDNKELSIEHDIFPDNYTRREIEQIRMKCCYSPLGCNVEASPIELNEHVPTCPYKQQQEQLEEKCPYASVKCNFIGRPETNALEQHLKDDMALHIRLILQSHEQLVSATWAPQKSLKPLANGTLLPPPPPQYANKADEIFIQELCNRIVILEQRAREQDIKIENLTKQLTNFRQQINPRYSNGIIVWEINNFHKLIEHLRANVHHQEYSHECYTSPYGYKFCGRLNIQTNKEHLLSLHVHLMQSENDCHLDWPFKGRIKLCMVHPRDANLSQHDTIMTNPVVKAFNKPCEPTSSRGFGFTEYANISEIIHKGFCEGDRLVIKIQINIV